MTTPTEQIKEMLKDGEPYFQDEIRVRLGNPDRAILTGYLRCLSDLGEIESKDNGRAKVYFVKKGNKIRWNKNE